ncbi:hypothetical protein PIB30_035857 [Stylosanthes scabra]|uniref:Uncharacterized protein n=1 Tax=Stylosanthes scabra TaxID=79078 RepID=A0ABU6RDF7_9FABA|nr:hypothetical protein [Stylosanthes scabra]
MGGSSRAPSHFTLIANLLDLLLCFALLPPQVIVPQICTAAPLRVLSRPSTRALIAVFFFQAMVQRFFYPNCRSGVGNHEFSKICFDQADVATVRSPAVLVAVSSPPPPLLYHIRELPTSLLSLPTCWIYYFALHFYLLKSLSPLICTVASLCVLSQPATRALIAADVAAVRSPAVLVAVSSPPPPLLYHLESETMDFLRSASIRQMSPSSDLLPPF